MTKIRVVMSSQGAIALMNSLEMLQHIGAVSTRIADDAGEGFIADVQPGRTRARGMVKSSTYESMKAQAESSVLTKAIRK